MNIQRLILICLLSVLLPAAALAKKKPPEPDQKTASVNMTVIRNSSGKPVKNAEVVIHLIDKHGNAKQEGMELKTHDDGKAEATGIPYGKVRIQVIAPGFKTLEKTSASISRTMNSPSNCKNRPSSFPFTNDESWAGQAVPQQ